MRAVGPIVYAITEGLGDDSNFLQQKQKITSRISRSADCGVTLFQIREKQLSAALLFELVRASVEAATATGLKILVNGRFDIAMAAGADGVHLPADGLPVEAVRAHVPDDFLIGVSTHSAEDARAAKDGGADLIVFGPVFESPGKRAAAGLENLREVCNVASPTPVLALGGLDENNFRKVVDVGASGFAAIRFLNNVIDRGERIAF